MEPDTTPEEELREFQSLLVTIVKRITRQIFSNARLTQIDVGRAMSMVVGVQYPQVIYVRKALPELLRELGKPRPDLRRYVEVLEQAVVYIEEQLAGRR